MRLAMVLHAVVLTLSVGCFAQTTATSPAETIDTSRNGTYTSAPWEYRVTISGEGTRSEGYTGKLFCHGKELPAPDGVNDFYETPWGKMYWVGRPKVPFGAHGWMPKPLPSQPVGKALAAPAPATQPATTATSGPASGSTTTVAAPQLSPEDAIGYFWKTLSAADVDAAGKFYADEVTLKYFHELLKKEYGLVDKDGWNQDLTVGREKVVAGYQKMMTAIGKAKWVKAMSKIPADKITISRADSDGKPFAECRKGDWILKVSPKEDEGFVYVFRLNDKGHIRIVAEKCDY
jgi:hypothetical protein